VIKLRYTIPNGFTALSLLLGVGSIVTGQLGDLELAGWMIVWCGLLDVLDGVAARLLKATSDFGAEFDSMADLVAFGVAPSMLVLQAGMEIGGVSLDTGAFWVLLVPDHGQAANRVVSRPADYRGRWWTRLHGGHPACSLPGHCRDDAFASLSADRHVRTRAWHDFDNQVSEDHETQEQCHQRVSAVQCACLVLLRHYPQLSRIPVLHGVVPADCRDHRRQDYQG
jgi:hypothetical protein